MSDFLNIGVSGLIAFQRALATTGHNIANANTPGFSRQQALLASRTGFQSGVGGSGQGTQVTGVRRIYDQFLTNQVHANTATFNRLDVFHSLSGQVDNLLADGGSSVGTMLQNFFNALDTVADDPASLVTREAFLGQARGLVQRFDQADSRLEALDRDVNGRLSAAVSEINAIAGSIADLNAQIVSGSSRGNPPNDLIDQRDMLIGELNRHVAVSTVSDGNGATNVFVGNGMALVRNTVAEPLQTFRNRFEAGRLDVGFVDGPPITSRLSGGELGGALDFRREVLDPARNALGRLASGLADRLNAQHREGMDLTGQLGGDLFAVGAPVGVGSSGNAGTAVMNVVIDDLGSLSTHDYILRYDGAAWQARRADTGEPATMSGAGTVADPFVLDGVAIDVGPGAAAGDQFLVRPTVNAVNGMRLLIDDPSRIAAAAAIVASTSTGNSGTAQISIGEVIDGADPALMTPQTITFIDPNTYTIGAAGPFAYTSGAAIDFNGWRVEISGTPAAGDTFTVTANSAGGADNRNALLLSGLQTLGVLDNGTSSLGDSFNVLAASVGTVTHYAEINRDAQQVLLDNTEQARLAVSGVNLDEEAANLLRYEQSYQAAARVISVADELFQTLIGAVAR